MVYVQELSIAIVGGVFAYFFHRQKRKLATESFVIHHFQEFNRRYEKLNEYLSEIVCYYQDKLEIDPHDPRSRKFQDTLNNYINLCAEEHLMYKKGYVLPEAWTSWRAGMCYYLKIPAIRNFFQHECLNSKDSYYGLSLEVIEKGFQQPNSNISALPEREAQERDISKWIKNAG